jgi:hypothetical protein
VRYGTTLLEVAHERIEAEAIDGLERQLDELGRAGNARR